MLTSYKYRYIHKHIDSGCGNIAFYFDTEPRRGGRIMSEEVMFEDRSKPNPGDPFRCGSCGKIFDRIILEHVESNN